jgi:uncharacterized protein involved in exopolysaccharide biosynthesis
MRALARETRTTGSEAQIAALEHEHAQLQQSYLALLKEQTEAQLAETRARSRPGEVFLVAEAATPASRPYFPVPSLFALAGLLVGLGVGLVAAVVVEARDDSIKSGAGLQELLPYPLLAEIPLVKSKASHR